MAWVHWWHNCVIIIFVPTGRVTGASVMTIIIPICMIGLVVGFILMGLFVTGLIVGVNVMGLRVGARLVVAQQPGVVTASLTKVH
jgi:hypothetical protein